MTENRLEVLAGLAVLALSAGFLWYLLQDNSSIGGGGTYEVGASFSSAQGVSVGSDIRIAGVKVGEVSGMTLNTEQLVAELLLSVQSGESKFRTTARRRLPRKDCWADILLKLCRVVRLQTWKMATRSSIRRAMSG